MLDLAHCTLICQEALWGLSSHESDMPQYCFLGPLQT